MTISVLLSCITEVWNVNDKIWSWTEKMKNGAISCCYIAMSECIVLHEEHNGKTIVLVIVLTSIEAKDASSVSCCLYVCLWKNLFQNKSPTVAAVKWPLILPLVLYKVSTDTQVSYC